MTTPQSNSIDPTHTRLVVGCMTGTSLDGLDAALVRVTGNGLHMTAQFIRGISQPLGSCGPQLRALAEQQPLTAREITATLHAFAHLHASTLATLIAPERSTASPHSPIALVCIHGQTVFHSPPLSWQAFNPAPVAHALQTPIVSDLRQADLAAGGQGAPITPIADLVLFSGPRERLIVNLGGFCNVTLLPPRDANPTETLPRIRAADLCACNQLLDGIARRFLNRPYDADGQAALAGTPHPATTAQLTAHLTKQSNAGRSLGTGDELETLLSSFASIPANDLARSACEAIANVVTARFPTADPVLAGGGVRNAALVQAFQTRAPRTTTSDELHVPADFREAVCFAVLGALCADGVPITLPQVTGCTAPAPVAGLWTLPNASPFLPTTNPPRYAPP